MRTLRMLLAPDSVDGGGNTDDGGKDGTDRTDAFQRLLDKKNGDAQALAFLLWNENKSYREKNAELKARLPQDGAVVLAGDEAKAWSAFQALGSPDDVKRKVREHADLAGRVAAHEREKSLAEVARKAGVQNVPAFLKVAGTAEFEVREVKSDGKVTHEVFVKDGDAEPAPFDAHFADFLPALRPDAKAAPGPLGTPRRDLHRTPTVAGPDPAAGGRRAPHPESSEGRRAEFARAGLGLF